MVSNNRVGTVVTHVLLILGVALMCFPIWLTFVGSTVTQQEIVRPPLPLLPGGQMIENYRNALFSGVTVPVGRMLFNSTVMALGIALGKIAISLLSAFAIVYFRFPGRMLCFWTIFMTLMLPEEVRIVPT